MTRLFYRSQPFLIACLLGTSVVLAQTAGGIRGTAVDDSGGVLPGVIVTATSPGGRVTGSSITNAAGTFELKSLPSGPTTLTFQLDGFAPAVIDLRVFGGEESRVVGHLKLATLAETMVVHGRAPIEPPARPRPVVVPVPIHDRASVCGPARAAGPLPSLGTIRSRKDTARALYSEGDELIIDGGTFDGLQVGRNFAVRRRYRVAGERDHALVGEHTSGVVQIVRADVNESTAIVLYACDEMVKGDYLDAFEPAPAAPLDAPGMPNYDDTAVILFADVDQIIGVPRRLMVIDRGATGGIRPGQRLTLFRPARRLEPRAVVGEAVVVAVRAESATIRVEQATDAVLFGDRAALQK